MANEEKLESVRKLAETMVEDGDVYVKQWGLWLLDILSGVKTDDEGIPYEEE